MPEQLPSPRSLTCIGSLLADDIAKPKKKLHQGASNPVIWEQHLGGVAANVATAAALHCDTTLVSAVGHDIDALLEDPKLDKVTPAWIRFPRANDRYTAVLTPRGDLYVGLASTELTEGLAFDDVEPLLPQAAHCYAIDANLNPDCLAELVAYLRGLAHHPTLVALPVSPEKAVKWLSCANRVDLLFCNRREAAALTTLPGDATTAQYISALRDLGFTDIVLTDADKPIAVLQADEMTKIDIPECKITATVNGAGDALVGATLAHYCQNYELVSCIRRAGLIAAHCVLKGSPISYPAPVST